MQVGGKLNNKMLNSIYMLPPGQTLSGLIKAEPGMEIQCKANSARQRMLVERVRFEHGYKKKHRFRYYPLGSERPVNEDLIVGARWPVEGQRPDFQNGYEYQINSKEYRVLTQTSLAPLAHVYVIDLETNIIYSMPKRELKEIISSNDGRTSDSALGSQELDVAVRIHR